MFLWDNGQMKGSSRRWELLFMKGKGWRVFWVRLGKGGGKGAGGRAHVVRREEGFVLHWVAQGLDVP